MSDLTILCLASYFKGQRFMQQAHKRGAKVYLLTIEKLLGHAWPREALADVFAQANEPTLADTIRTVSYLARERKFDRVVPMDDFDVETAAALREHFRLPGMGDTTARFFRDKLAMRVRAKEAGIPVPDFTGVFHHDDVRAFTRRTPPPWMNKPRSQAGATGITKVTSEEQLWSLIGTQNDLQSFHLLEEYLPGDVYHVDSITRGGEVVFAAAHKCGTPPFDVAHGGGIFTSVALERGKGDEPALLALNAKVLKAFGLEYGAAHVEFIKGRKDGKLTMLEAGARVGGAHIAELIEASTGLNPWAEWADVEIDGASYRPAPARAEYGGLIITLARQERPDFSAYTDPEIVYHAPEASHAGLVVRSPDAARTAALIASYTERFRADFMTSLPAASAPGH